jgi:uncharacterized phiE125 gp8 family phage protein
MKYRVTEQPASEPVSLEDARTHLRVTPYGSPLAHPDDDYITALIPTARNFCEEYLRRGLATQTIQFGLDVFDDDIAVPLQPVQSIESITYIDTAGAEQTLATSVYELDEYEGVIRLKYGQRWPSTRDQSNAVTVTAVVGYTNGESPDSYPVPAPIKAAMLLIIGNLYEHRTQDVVNGSQLNFNSLPMGVYSLLQPYRLGMGL